VTTVYGTGNGAPAALGISSSEDDDAGAALLQGGHDVVCDGLADGEVAFVEAKVHRIGSVSLQVWHLV